MVRWVAVLCVLVLGACDGAPDEVQPHSWVLIYYLAYDNDLSRHADNILDELTQALPSDRVAILALVDRAGPGGLERHVITRAGGRQTTRLDQEDSAGVETLLALLDYAVEELPAERYGLFLLGHGGAEGRWAYDQDPGEPGPSWMELAHLGTELRRLRRQGEPSLDLLFLQQCGRAALTTWSAFAGSARVVMASQALVGAPNDYYAGTLAFLGVRPDADAEVLAKIIMNHESPGMFADYVAFRGDALGELPGRVQAVLDPVLDLPEVSPAGANGSLPPTVTFQYRDEIHVDLLQWLAALYAANHLDPTAVHELGLWLEGDILVARRVSPRHAPLGIGLCGVSMPLSG